jgi:hypothetical protein
MMPGLQGIGKSTFKITFFTITKLYQGGHPGFGATVKISTIFDGVWSCAGGDEKAVFLNQGIQSCIQHVSF